MPDPPMTLAQLRVALRTLQSQLDTADQQLAAAYLAMAIDALADNPAMQ